MDFMSFTKNLVKELGDGFQLSDISNAVVKTLDGGDDAQRLIRWTERAILDTAKEKIVL